MLAFLGWNPGTNQEIFSLDELVSAFTLDRVAKAGAKFDPDKTRWYQQQYLRNKSNEELAGLLSQKLNGDYDLSRLPAVCGMMKERATFVEDILTEGVFLFDSPADYDEKSVRKKWKENSADLMSEWKTELSNIETFDAASIEASFKSFLEKKELGIGAVLPLFRLLVTGKGMGPSMFEIAEFLGKEECLNRMETGMVSVQTANA